ncbi:MAG: 23S rRNA (uracil(1939)-C(5))-methyltransferase RlmD [Bacteroidales bacterium]|jgi:23S rRNA (uracil1939-C5)-methyltransferase|nr:23S rRNA (uracil(1939)-C(5))-methyltransferase RlmD [Bacteroidales bacterium]MDD2686836.1 23S rRNA (uracil(1939)-C(5))-methyltransferase RlmD [Bacteroidales bacterium]MDD3329852.1 23S rRNA (uracil(1939)-C(5))-methyltransferase RlmD [Bacteroidales bacterium]MDD3690716.1 23S rRNA (uracil(1939)-C(5))-methyltransferase RlmD [Bacteroidales bacterium]MDD4043985.1 23S rRNA (uracil(1939)-C(5))-methyltransferase RlmD [Bacteroidales bacterium]
MGKKKQIIIENLEIKDAGAEGVSVGRYQDTVVFVPYAVPGDIVDVKALKKRTYYHAQLLKIKTPSPHRIAPLCQHFGFCGGCKWQQMDYTTQLQYKQKQIIDNFIRIGKFPFPQVMPILASDPIFAYRNKIEYTFSPRRWILEKEITQDQDIDKRGLGFHIQGMFDRVLDIETCHLHPDIGNKIRNAIKAYAIDHNLAFWDARDKIGFLRNLMMRFSSCGDLMLIVVFQTYDKSAENMMQYIHQQFPEITSLIYVVNEKDNDVITDLPIHLYAGKDYITEKMNDLQFKISPHAFYQTNSRQALQLYKTVEDFAQTQTNELVYDLYTGTGTIALFLARNAKKVIGIEYIDSAVADAFENAKNNHIHNVDFYAGDIAKVLTPEFVHTHGKPQLIISDPPRAGMHPDVIKQILSIEAEKIVYVSCNPATQARDIAMMSDTYKVEKVQAVDMFPHTHHIENVVLLRVNK